MELCREQTAYEPAEGVTVYLECIRETGHEGQHIINTGGVYWADFNGHVPGLAVGPRGPRLGGEFSIPYCGRVLTVREAAKAIRDELMSTARSTVNLGLS